MHGNFFYLQAIHAASKPRSRRARPRRVRPSAVLAALILSSFVALCGCTDAGPQRLRVFAAASLQELAADLAILFEERYGVALGVADASHEALGTPVRMAATINAKR